MSFLLYFRVLCPLGEFNVWSLNAALEVASCWRVCCVIDVSAALSALAVMLAVSEELEACVLGRQYGLPAKLRAPVFQ